MSKDNLTEFDKQKLQQLQELYESLPWDLVNKFKKKNALVYASFLDEFLHEFLHEDDTLEETFDNMLEQADILNNPDKHLIVFRQKDIVRKIVK